MDMEARDANYIAGTPYTGATVRMRPAKGVSAGALIAWDVAAGKAAWKAGCGAETTQAPTIPASRTNTGRISRSSIAFHAVERRRHLMRSSG
jgi:hypothetical protein